jgi:hypothetical protein
MISLAGVLYEVGLLPPSNSEQIPFVSTMYLYTSDLGWDQ